MNWDKFMHDLDESLFNANLPPSKLKNTIQETASQKGSPRHQVLDSRAMQSAPSTPAFSRKMNNCFGKFDGVSYDLSNASPVQALANISALKILTTSELVDEDPTMAIARPHLSKINQAGFLTTESQMGKKELDKVDADSLWQRSYVKGLLPRHVADAFRQQLSLEDSVFVVIDEPDDRDCYVARGMMIPLTFEGGFYARYGGSLFPTNAPVTGLESFTEIVWNLLPEVKSIMTSEKCVNLVKEDAMKVLVVDMTWGRPFWLFEKIVEVLGELNDAYAKSKAAKSFF